MLVSEQNSSSSLDLRCYCFCFKCFCNLTFNFWKTSFEKNCFSAWASTLNMGLINKVDMVCFSPVGYGV